MKLSKPSLLLHPIFIINLLVLLANDLWWKYAYTSWLTGKLSDFSGIFVFTVLLNAVFPGRKIYTATCTVVFFTWWKSSFSDAFIEWANTVLQWPVHRTIDYSDLIALIVIPAAGYLKPFHLRFNLLTVLIKPAMYLCTIIAICATYMPRRPFLQYPAGLVYLDKTFKTRLTKEAVLYKLDSLQIDYKFDSVEMLPVVAQDYFLKIDHGKDSTAEWIKADEIQSPTLYYKITLTPYYNIPELALEKDTIRNIKFRILEGKRKRTIEFITMELTKDLDVSYYLRSRQAKKYQSMIYSILTK